MKLDILTIAVFSISLTGVFSWADTGHLLTAQVAKNELLASNPDAYKDYEDLVLKINNLTNGKSNSFVESACWPDDLKFAKMNFWDNWHFVDRNYNVDGLDSTGMYKEINLLYALNQTFLVLNDVNSGNEVGQSMMARYVIHLIGDLHQPLHCTSLIDYEFPKGDQGGNAINITYNGEKLELHGFWDSGLRVWNRLSRPLTEDSVNYLQTLASNITQKYPRSYFSEELLLGLNFEQWTLESYKLAQQFTYSGVWNNTNRDLPQSYVDKNYELVEQRIALGGYRLADTIANYISNRNQALKANTTEESKAFLQ